MNLIKKLPFDLHMAIIPHQRFCYSGSKGGMIVHSKLNSSFSSSLTNEVIWSCKLDNPSGCLSTSSFALAQTQRTWWGWNFCFVMSCPFFFISSAHHIYSISLQLRKRTLQWQGFMRAPRDVTPLANSVYNCTQFGDQYSSSFENKLPPFQSLQRDASNDGQRYLTTPISSSSAL